MDNLENNKGKIISYYDYNISASILFKCTLHGPVNSAYYCPKCSVLKRTNYGNHIYKNNKNYRNRNNNNKIFRGHFSNINSSNIIRNNNGINFNDRTRNLLIRENENNINTINNRYQQPIDYPNSDNNTINQANITNTSILSNDNVSFAQSYITNIGNSELFYQNKLKKIKDLTEELNIPSISNSTNLLDNFTPIIVPDLLNDPSNDSPNDPSNDSPNDPSNDSPNDPSNDYQNYPPANLSYLPSFNLNPTNGDLGQIIDSQPGYSNLLNNTIHNILSETEETRSATLLDISNNDLQLDINGSSINIQSAVDELSYVPEIISVESIDSNVNYSPINYNIEFINNTPDVEYSYEYLVSLENVPSGLTSEQINNHSKLFINELIYDKCTICQSKFEHEEIIRTLQCKHQYHINCIDKWLKNNKKCPICQTS